MFFYSNHDVKESTLCVLCTEAVDKEEAVILTEKGSENINAISRCRNEELNQNHLKQFMKDVECYTYIPTTFKRIC